MVCYLGFVVVSVVDGLLCVVCCLLVCWFVGFLVLYADVCRVLRCLWFAVLFGDCEVIVDV